MNIDDNSMHNLVRSFTRSTRGDLKQNANGNDFVTDNGEVIYGWNYTFSDIARTAINNDLKYIVVKRNKIWKFVAVLSQDGKELLLFFKEQNLRNVLSKFEGKPFHYLSCLLIKNMHLNGQEIAHQSTLFEGLDVDEKKEIDEKRMLEAKKMLKEDFEKIKTVYVCSKEEISGETVSVKMNKLNARGEIVEQEDITRYMLLDYEVTSAVNNDNDKTPTIPQLKVKFKEQKKSIIPNEKRYEEKNTKKEND